MTTINLNTKFFHMSTIIRRRSNSIESLKLNQSHWTTDQNEIQNMILDQLKNMYISSNASSHSGLEDLFPEKISEMDNNFLCEIPTDDEIISTFKQTPSTKAPGPDGFIGLFYKQYWDIIKIDFIVAIKNFFIHGKLLKELNHKQIALILKMNSPNTVHQYWPISLSNVYYKVIAKILANRLKRILPKIISPHQTAFIPGRIIQENTLLAQEVFHHLKKKKRQKWTYGS